MLDHTERPTDLEQSQHLYQPSGTWRRVGRWPMALVPTRGSGFRAHLNPAYWCIPNMGKTQEYKTLPPSVIEPEDDPDVGRLQPAVVAEEIPQLVV